MPTAIACKMCNDTIEGQSFHSDTFDGEVCQECAECCRDAVKQIRYYGPRAGIVGELKNEP